MNAENNIKSSECVDCEPECMNRGGFNNAES